MDHQDALEDEDEDSCEIVSLDDLRCANELKVMKMCMDGNEYDLDNWEYFWWVLNQKAK